MGLDMKRVENGRVHRASSQVHAGPLQLRAYSTAKWLTGDWKLLHTLVEWFAFCDTVLTVGGRHYLMSVMDDLYLGTLL